MQHEQRANFLLFGDSSTPESPVVPKRRSPPRRQVRTRKLPDDHIANEYELTRKLEEGLYSIDELIAMSEKAGVAERDNGYARVSNGAIRHEHRMHGAIQKMKQKDLAENRGRGLWYIKGTPKVPTWATFVIMGDPSEITLALGAAAEMAKRIDEPVDLIFCDPPWQIGSNMTGNAGPNGKARNRDYSRVLGGYREVPSDRDYRDFSLEWMGVASGLLRPGGYLAVVTDAERSGDVQRAGTDSGLRFQNSLVIQKPNYVPITSRRFAPSQTRITVLTSGPRSLASRTFNPLPEHGFAQSGQPYPQDVWTHIENYYRRGLLRYSNQLSPQLVDEILRTYTNPGDFGVDFFAGSGTFPLVCLLRGRRAFASDLNPEALRFTMGRILDVFQQQKAQLDFGGTFAESVAMGLS